MRSIDQKRWLTLFASCLINLCIGSVGAWSVFASPLAEHLSAISGVQLTAGSLMLAFTLANGVAPVTMISGGIINDKLGPKWVVFLGGLMVGGGMLMTSLAETAIVVIVGYGVVFGLGMGLVYGCTIGNTVKLFPDRRGFAGGMITATYGLSSTVISPVANTLIQRLGVMSAFQILGLCYLLIICVGAFVVVTCPRDYQPAGWAPPVRSGGAAVTDRNWREMLCDPIFYVMILMLTCGAFFGLMTVSQASPVAQRMIGMGVSDAAAVVAVLSLFNAAGRLLCGMISDRIGNLMTLGMAFVCSVVGLLLLFTSGTGSVVQFYAGICIVGFCYGAFMGIFPGFTASQFGSRNNSVNYGIMFIGFALAGLWGPSIMGTIFEHTGTYQPAFLVAIGLAVVGLLLVAAYRKAACTAYRHAELTVKGS